MGNKATSTVARRLAKQPAPRLRLIGAAEPEAYEPETGENLAAINPSGFEEEDHFEDKVEAEVLAEETGGTEDLVGIYLREMGVTPMLTREGEAALAVRIERGRRRAAKAISRMPICIEEIIAIGECLKRGQLHIREAINFRDQEDITEAGIQETLISTLDSIAEISAEYKRALKLYARVQDEPKRSRRRPRLLRKLARQRVEVSRLCRAIDLTSSHRAHLAGLIREGSARLGSSKGQRKRPAPRLSAREAAEPMTASATTTGARFIRTLSLHTLFR